MVYRRRRLFVFCRGSLHRRETAREPNTNTYHTVIMAGLAEFCYRLRKGINDFRIIGKGGDFGGTWYWNRYPGDLAN